MTGPFLGSIAVADGEMSKYELASRHVRLFPDAYVPRDLAVRVRRRHRIAPRPRRLGPETRRA
jgi:hypothetical protein